MSGAPRHLHGLDGLRGLAALVVVITHCFGALELDAALKRQILAGPAILFLNAGGAVQLFFVLSGFVLAGSLTRHRHWTDMPQYFVCRVFRIHPPYVFAVLFAWLASFAYPAYAPGEGVGPWVQHLSRIHLSIPELLESFTFPGTANLQLSVGWTLEVEMIFSFLMPVLLALAVGVHWTILLAFSAAPLLYGPDGMPVMKFAIDFALGVALFVERERLARWLGGLGLPGAMVVTVLSLTVFELPWWLGWHPKPSGEPAAITVMGVGAAGLTAAAAFVPAVARALSTQACRFLGRVSYSLYLLHYPLVILFARILTPPADVVDFVVLLAYVLGAGLPLSALSYRLVERPAIRLGNQLCRRLARRLGAPPVESRLVEPEARAAGAA